MNDEEWTYEELLEEYNSLSKDNTFLERELNRVQTFYDSEKASYDLLKEQIKKITEECVEREKEIKKLIPELEDRHGKRSTRRMLLAWCILSGIILFSCFRSPVDNFMDALRILVISPLIGGAVLFIVFGISSCTFSKNVDDSIPIIKLETELLETKLTISRLRRLDI